MPRKSRDTRKHGKVKSVEYVRKKKEDAIAQSTSQRIRKDKKNASEPTSISLRPSSDVYHRLLWDQTLPWDPSSVKIGYSEGKADAPGLCADGVAECLLIDWVPIEKGGDIPMHHILYFKLINLGRSGDRCLMLWDRHSRLDRIFGSGLTKISQIWQNSRLIQEELSKIIRETHAGSQIERAEDTRNHKTTETTTAISSHQESPPSSSSSSSSAKRKRRRRKNKDTAESSSSSSVILPSSMMFSRIPRTKTSEAFGSPLWMESVLFERYPCDPNNPEWSLSFSLDQSDEWLPILFKYGCVVIKDIFDHSRIDQTVDAMLDEAHMCRVRAKSQSKEMMNDERIEKPSLDNAYTWRDQNWPNPGDRFLFKNSALHKQAFLNRIDERMETVFQSIYETQTPVESDSLVPIQCDDSSIIEDDCLSSVRTVVKKKKNQQKQRRRKLGVTIDRWGIYRGTEGLTFYHPQTGEVMGMSVDMPKWKRSLGPHIDVNPWVYTEDCNQGHSERLYQGALALSDQRRCDGTHLTLPCFATRYLDVFVAHQKRQQRHRFDLPKDHPFHALMQPIPLRKGEMVIWDFGQLHGTSENHSNRMRLCQYIRMFPDSQRYWDGDHLSAKNVLRKMPEVSIKRIIGRMSSNRRVHQLLGL